MDRVNRWQHEPLVYLMHIILINMYISALFIIDKCVLIRPSIDPDM